MVTELNHIGILTGDMEASRKLYEEMLGGVVIRDFVNAEGLSQFVYIQLARGVIELIRVAADADNRGYAHVAFLTDQSKQLESYHSELVDLGYQFTVPPKKASSGDGWLAFYKDTSGAVFELIQRTENIRIRDHESPVLKAFNYTAIFTRHESAVKCSEFYQSAMGLQKTDTLAPGQNVYTCGEDSILLAETEDASLLSSPLQYMNFCAADCDGLRRRLTQEGIACTEIVDADGYARFDAVGCDGEKLVFTDRQTKK